MMRWNLIRLNDSTRLAVGLVVLLLTVALFIVESVRGREAAMFLFESAALFSPFLVYAPLIAAWARRGWAAPVLLAIFGACFPLWAGLIYPLAVDSRGDWGFGFLFFAVPGALVALSAGLRLATGGWRAALGPPAGVAIALAMVPVDPGVCGAAFSWHAAMLSCLLWWGAVVRR